MGILEVVGVASILPFMELVSKPDAVYESRYLQFAFEFFQFEDTRQMLIYFGIGIIGLIGITNAFAIAAMWYQYKLSWDVAHQLSARLLLSFIKKPYGYFLNENTNNIKAYVISEVGSLIGGVIIPIIELVSRGFVSIIIFTLLLIVDPKIALIAFLGLGGAYFIIFLARKNYLKEIGKHRISMNLMRYTSITELFDGIKTIMMYNKLPFFYKRFEKASREFTNVQPKYNMILVAPKYILEFLAFGSVLAFTIYLYISGGNIQSALPRLSLFAVAGYRLLPALQKIFNSAGRIRHNYPVLGKLHNDLKVIEKGSIEMKSEDTILGFNESIVMSGIEFKYKNAEYPVLCDLDLRISKGEMVAFVGATGSGKTTIVDIIAGLHTPQKGKLMLDNVELRTEDIQSWQNSIAYVTQEVFLFDESILRNISMEEDKSLVDYDRLEKAAMKADIHDFIINELTEGYDTEIGEKGVRLSGGQRQRLGLARALYAKPSVLILDEATSALDSITEKGIINTIKTLPGNITKIIIAHRLSTVKYSDNIYIIEDGKIAAQGKFDDLASNNSIFQKMVEHS
jgi:ATP-binding cassette subfamily C protein